MSNRTLIVAILLAVGLGIVTLLVLRGGAGTGSRSVVAPGGRLMEFDPAGVRAIVLTPPGRGGGTGQPGGEGATRVERDADGVETWWMTFPEATAPATGQRPRWRVEPGRVRDVLRVLSTITAIGAPEAGAALGDSAATVTLQMRGGEELTLRLAGRVLGGQGLVEVTTPPGNVPASEPMTPMPVSGPGAAAGVTRRALVASSLHAVFQTEAIRQWRETGVMTGALAEATRVRLAGVPAAPGSTAPGQTGTIALGKVGGAWGLTEPLGAPADAAAVQRLLTALEGVRAARFFDAGAPAGATTGLDAPAARIRLEADRAAWTVRELLIGAPADTAGKVRYATIDGGATLIGIDAAPLANLSTDPTAYLSRTATAVASPDIGLLMFVAAPAPGSSPGDAGVSMGFLRRIDGWVELRPDGQQVLQDPKRAEAIAAFLQFLTVEPAGSVGLSAPAGYQAIGTLSLRSAGDAPLDDLEIGRLAATGVVVRRGPVYRVYGGVPELLRAALGPIEPNRGVTEDGEPARDVTK